MKNTKLLSAGLLLLVALSSCTASTEHGECVGIMEEGRPDLNYKLSGRNLAWSILGLEMLFPPVLWATDYAMCPSGPRSKRGAPAILRDTPLVDESPPLDTPASP